MVDDRIRLAYVSPDFRSHPVGQLLAGVIERHDRDRFEVMGVSLGPDDGSELAARFKASMSPFLEVRGRGAREIVEQVRSYHPDIALDLAGFTADSRSELFASRLAPVQVNWLGYPGTCGGSAHDYILADEFVIPPGFERFYSEKVVRLPHTYLPIGDAAEQVGDPPTRAACGLPEKGFVFCSMNHCFKITRKLFCVWMRLLSRVHGSVLWLRDDGDIIKRNLWREAESSGVSRDRIVFAPRLPSLTEHLARYRVADLFLDTHPYNAHTTAADALCAGLPVLTFSGESFASRVAGSLLTTLGLPELICYSVEEYEAQALNLSTDRQLLDSIRDRLGHARHRSPLFDAEAFCRSLEACLIALVEVGRVRTAG